jgi:hypothetical protein
MYFIDLLQHDYEVVRPIVLFGDTTAEHCRQTGIDRTVIGDKARRFITDGMIGLTDGRTQPRPSNGPIYPEALAGYIIYLKPRYPPFACVKSSTFCFANSVTKPIEIVGPKYCSYTSAGFGLYCWLMCSPASRWWIEWPRVACLARGSPRPVHGQGQAGSRC